MRGRGKKSPRPRRFAAAFQKFFPKRNEFRERGFYPLVVGACRQAASTPKEAKQ
jgi:hypothetical protein